MTTDARQGCSHDPYWKLRPLGPTPDEEICHCSSIGSIMLRDSLSPNPLYCVHCNGEVAPERIGFSETIAEQIAFWRGLFRSLYVLWLDSGEYEQWALQQLTNPRGTVNVRGMECAASLNQFTRTYYWWFVDNSAAGFVEPTDCFVCGKSLSPMPRGFFKPANRARS